MTATEPPLYLFDGVCVLCNRSVRFVLDHERGPEIRFAATQSETGRALLARLDLPEMPDSFVFVADGRVFERSAAVIAVARHLRAPWSWVAGVAGLLPAAPLDWLYDRVARNRYRLFGRYATCLVPDAGLRARFMP